ncbi:MAG: hypothetical protein HKL90_09330, partial [Elusimicrobia bacterium]|nr:hypothetical protein [Elusimicrobiota bacterium]
FLLRGVDHEELVGSAQAAGVIAKGGKSGKHKKLSDGAIAEVFGIELENPSAASLLPPRKIRTPKTAGNPKNPRCVADRGGKSRSDRSRRRRRA